jgi:thermostable 8-oxoguanine DNA glycosylase
MPSLKTIFRHDFMVKIISSNQEANDLVADGLEDFRLYVFYGKEALGLGAIAFCIYVDKELAHVGWAAFSEEGKTHIKEFCSHR